MENGATYNQPTEGTLSNLVIFSESEFEESIGRNETPLQICHQLFFHQYLTILYGINLFIATSYKKCWRKKQFSNDLFETKILIFEIDLYVTHSVWSQYWSYS